MSETQQATAASVEFPLGDKVYKLSPMTDEDIAEIDNYLYSTIIERAFRSCEKLPEKQRDAVIRHAVEYASTVTMISRDGMKILGSLEGWSRVLWQGIRKNHPEITERDITRALTDPAVLEKTRVYWERANQLGKSQSPEDSPGVMNQ